MKKNRSARVPATVDCHTVDWSYEMIHVPPAKRWPQAAMQWVSDPSSHPVPYQLYPTICVCVIFDKKLYKGHSVL